MTTDLILIAVLLGSIVLFVVFFLYFVPVGLDDRPAFDEAELRRHVVLQH